VFLIGSGFALAGAAASWFLLPDKATSLDVEDERFRQLLLDSGYASDSLVGEILKDNLKFSVYEFQRRELERQDAHRDRRLSAI